MDHFTKVKLVFQKMGLIYTTSETVSQIWANTAKYVRGYNPDLTEK